MIKELCIIGHPSKLGGADTELDHQIRCWQKMGITVHICHTAFIDNNCKKMGMEKRGCIYHVSKDWKSLTGMHTISFCNGEFLKNLIKIKKHTKTTTFVNCMTWNFKKEIEAQERGLIDFHLYQTKEQFERVSKKLITKGSVYRSIIFQPYFHQEDFKYKDNRNNSVFQFGRISRGDADKYSRTQFWVYETMVSPVPKKGIILGWDHRAKKKFKGINTPVWIEKYTENKISQQEFYDFCDVLILQSDTFENLPRIGFEAMASGSVLVVNNRGGWKKLVENGKTGWLCDNERDFVYKASRIAHETQEKEDMRASAKEKLNKEWGIEESMKSWEKVFKQWEKIN